MNNQVKIQAKGEDNILIIPSRIGVELENANLVNYEGFISHAFNRELVTSLEIDKPKDVIVNVNGRDVKAKAYTVIGVNQLKNTDINIMNDMEELRMNKCPRCENEKLVENQKFCQICGLKLDTSKEGVIASLKELHDNPLLLPSERQTIEYAIIELEKTAQEAAVQEQYIKFDNLPTINSKEITFSGNVVD